MNTQIICDKCKRKIKIKQKHTKIVKVEKDIERMYFKCPYCNTKYTIAYSDAEFRDNIEKIKVIMAKIVDKTLSDNEIKELASNKDTLIARNKGISQRYRKMYEIES